MSKDVIYWSDGRTTRRAVVATGVKVAYTAPLVAASFKLTSQGVSAATCKDAAGKDCACSDGVCSCVCANYSPKQLNNKTQCYSCKTPGARCNATKSGVQADDLIPTEAGGEVCRCQGTTCCVNCPNDEACDDPTHPCVYKKDEIIDDGVCKPELLTCGGQPSR